jgi:hypothetical protein
MLSQSNRFRSETGRMLQPAVPLKTAWLAGARRRPARVTVLAIADGWHPWWPASGRR